MGSGSCCDQRDCASEDAKQCHVALDEGHIHEPTFHEADKFLVYTQTDISWCKDDRLRLFHLGFSDSDILVERNSCVPSEQPIHTHNLLSLIFSIRWPGDGYCRSFTVNFN